VATAADAGARQVTVTLAGTAVTANQYAGGTAVVTVTPDIGGCYRIKSHPAQTSTTGDVVLTLEDPIQVAWTTATRVDLVANPYNGVIITPTTAATSVPVGVAVYPIVAGEYGWIQVSGVAPCLVNASTALAVGVNVSAGVTVAGACDLADGDLCPVGVAVTGIADTEVGAINLLIS
jgi:hypothetical protein